MIPASKMTKPIPFAALCAMLSEASSIPIIILTINTFLSIYQALYQPWAVAFVVFTYTDLMLLLGCLHAFERLRYCGPSEMKERLKAAIWVLATAVNVALSCLAAEILPWGMAAVIWSMASLASFASFYMLFIFGQEPCCCVHFPRDMV